MSAPATTAKRSTAKKPVEHRMGTVTGLCDTCYDVHPVRLTVTAISTAKAKGYLTGACPVCQVATQYHSLIREVGDPHRDFEERNAEEERIARDAELTWHITELQRLGVKVRRDDEFAGPVVLVRWMDDGEYVLHLASEWDTLSHAQKLDILGQVRQRVDDPHGVYRWSVHPAIDDSAAYVAAAWGAE